LDWVGSKIFRRLVSWVGSWVSAGRLQKIMLSIWSVTEPCLSDMCISTTLFDALACTYYSVLKVIVIVRETSYWAVGWVVVGPNFSFMMGCVGSLSWWGWTGSKEMDPRTTLIYGTFGVHVFI